MNRLLHVLIGGCKDCPYANWANKDEVTDEVREQPKMAEYYYFKEAFFSNRCTHPSFPAGEDNAIVDGNTVLSQCPLPKIPKIS